MRTIHKHATCSLWNLRQRRYHTLITCSFMHFESWHLFSSVVALISFGPFAVTLFGPDGFLCLWIGSSFMASTATLLWDRFLEQSVPIVFRILKIGLHRIGQEFVMERHSFGASRSVLGLLMAFGCALPYHTVYCPMPLPAWQGAIITTTLLAGESRRNLSEM